MKFDRVFLVGAFTCIVCYVFFWLQNNNIDFSEIEASVNYQSDGNIELQRNFVMKTLTGDDVDHADNRLISVIQKYFLDKPQPYVTKMSFPLFLTTQADVVKEVLKKKRNGFFVEAGGLDGERSSNTLWLEQMLGWTGLLVEMDPSWYMQLRGKNRKCYSVNCCLSVTNHPTKMTFREHPRGQGKLVEEGIGTNVNNKNILQNFCFPLYSLMLAMNNAHIDYFSLDVEGFELPILRTIPWDKLNISVVGAEVAHGTEGKQAYIDFMEKQGYVLYKHVVKQIPQIIYYANDLIFVKKSLLA